MTDDAYCWEENPQVQKFYFFGLVSGPVVGLASLNCIMLLS